MANASNVQIPMLIDLIKNTNTESKGYGCYYGRIFKRKGLNLKGFARHITEHGGLVDYKMAVLVLQNIVECLKEMMLQGVPVKLDGLGTFSPGITGTPATSVEAYSVDNIVGVNMNFRPEGAGFEDEKLDKKTLKDSAVFELNDYVEVKYTDPDPVTGKRKSYQVRHPLKNYSIYKEDITPEP